MNINQQNYEGTTSWSTLSKDDFIEVSKKSDIFKFQGLDVTYVHNLMVERATGENISSKTFQFHIKRICLWIVMRGTNIRLGENPYEKTSPEGRAEIDSYVKIYKLYRPKKPVKNDDISLSRLAATYPHVILDIRIHALASKLPLMREIGVIPDGLPVAYAFPTGAALIPKSSTYNTAFNNWLSWAYSFDGVIKGTEPDVEKVNKYANIMRMNSPLPDNVREAMLKRAMDMENDPTTILSK